METFLLKKYVDRSLFKFGIKIPKTMHESLLGSLSTTLKVGESIPVKIFIADKEYDATFIWPESYKPDRVTLQICYDRNSSIAQALAQEFPTTYALMVDDLELQVEDSDYSSSEDVKEYINIYTSAKDTFRFECFNFAKLKELEENIKEISKGESHSWSIISDTVTTKKCDKSFFDHHGSTLPKETYSFFDAEDCIQGENRHISLFYDGVEYPARINTESLELKRRRLFWNADLSLRFNEHKGEANALARFDKLVEGKFVVNFVGEEKEVDYSVANCIRRIKKYIAAEGFNYEDGMIENFYLSLKTKPFVLLAGTSGTGKTRLVKLFAKALGATTDNGRFKMVSVRPDWSDSTDLFGHMDLNGNFIPGAIIDFVKRAELDIYHSYFLCLDEMNLARVEYYLSDVLSIIETRDFKKDKIVSDPLISATYYGEDQEASEKYGTIRLPENLYLVGTVNMDETTFPFSRKVLDRANTIEFSYVNLMPNFETAETDIVDPVEVGNVFLKTDYLLLKQCVSKAEKVEEYCSELQQLNNILKIAGAHVGYRVRDEIVFYLLNNQEYGLLSENEAMDNELMQKILPRIQGSSITVKKMLCEMFKFCAGDYDGYQSQSDDISGKMFKVVESKTAKYKKSAEKIAFMVRRFEEDGFTSYWL